MASIEKRGKTYRITVSLGFKEDGVTRVRKVTSFKPKYGMTEKQGRKAAEEFAAKFENTCKNVSNFDDSMTLAELTDWYFKTIAPHTLRATTLEKTRGAVASWFIPKLGGKRLSDLKPAVFAEHFRQLSLNGKRDGTPLSAISVNKARMLLNTIFSEAVKADIIPLNPITRVKAMKVERTERPVLTSDQARVFTERTLSVKSIWSGERILLLTSLLTGCRSSELRALTWNDINFDKGIININKSADDKNRITPPKSKASYRVIKATSFLLPILNQHRRDVQYYAVGVGRLWTENNLVFPDKLGGVIHISALGYAMKRLIYETDIPSGFSPHCLRHTFASLMINKGTDVKTVQGTLGHGSAIMTLDTYCHLFASAHAMAMEAVSDDITGADSDTLRRFLPPPEAVIEPVLKSGDNLETQDTKRGVKKQKETTQKK